MRERAFSSEMAPWLSLSPLCLCKVLFYLPPKTPLFECCACGHQTSLTVGTIFEKSRTSLSNWFQALYLHSREPGISAIRLMEAIGTTYKTAWLIGHKIRHAMSRTEAQERLSGNVHINCSQYGRPFNPTVYRHPQEHPLLIGAAVDLSGEVRHLKIKQIHASHLIEDRVTPAGRDAFIHENVDSDCMTIASVIHKFSPKRNRNLLAIGRKPRDGSMILSAESAPNTYRPIWTNLVTYSTTPGDMNPHSGRCC